MVLGFLNFPAGIFVSSCMLVVTVALSYFISCSDIFLSPFEYMLPVTLALFFDINPVLHI